MKKILYFISSRSLWIFIGIIGLSLLIWFIGPLIAIGEVKPISNKYIRLTIITLLLGIWLTNLIIKIIRQAKRNAALVNEIKAAQEPILKHHKTDSIMSRQFAEIDEVLKNAKFKGTNNKLFSKIGRGQYLYQMPWYVVLGAAGSGKTTALTHSGLNFPLESTIGTSISGLAGTRDCDWFLSDQAVLLDTAGRLSLHDDHNEQDAYDWKEFINLLKKYRPKQPINGVIVTVGVDDLLQHDDLKILAYQLRKRIHEMVKHLGINFPVYLMITKLDLLNGFTEYFQELNDSQRESYLGFNFATLNDQDNSEHLIGYVSKQLAIMADNINASAIHILDGLNNIKQKNNAFIFANEFVSLNEKLISLFKELYKCSKFESPILWRGIYFTSAQQNGTSLDPVFTQLSETIGLTNRYINTPLQTQKSHSYFLNKLFTDVIFQESNLASEDKAWYIKHTFLYWLGTATILSIAMMTIVLMINSYFNNRFYLNEVSEQALRLQKESENIKQTSDLLQAVEFAEKVKQLAITQNLPSPTSPPFTYRLGLYQGENMNEVTDASYQRILQDSVMPLISHKLDALLRQPQDNQNIDRYEALKAYLMMYQKKHFDAVFMNRWLMHSFEKDSTINNPEQKQKVQSALQVILSQQSIIPSVLYDKQLVDLRRNEIARNDITNMILSDTFHEISKQNSPLPPVSFETMGGIQSKLVFTRNSGKPISEPINPIYTKQAYLQYILPAILKSTNKLYKEEDWVLGNYASLKTNEAETLKQAQKAYFDRYISAWNAYIADIRLKQPKNLREAKNLAKILSDNANSPLANIIKGISQNTKLSISSTSEQPSSKIPKIMEQILTQTGINLSDNQKQNANQLFQETLGQDTLVDKAFTDFHLLTNKTEGQPNTIDNIILSIKDLYEYLDILDIAVEKGVDLPSNNSLFKYRSEVNRLPSPFRQMFDSFSDFILNKSLDEMNERINKAKEQEIQEQEEQAQQEMEKAEELKRQQEADLLVSLEKQLAPLTHECQEVLKQGYPFIKTSTNNVRLDAFGNIFGIQGGYAKFTVLSPEVASLAKANTLGELITRGEEYQKFAQIKNILPITQRYFEKGGNTPSLQATIKVISLDKSVDSLILDYGSEKYDYAHGPIIPYSIVWPAQQNNAVFNLRLYSDNNEVGNLKYQGVWSLFRMLEAGKIVKQTSTETVVSYDINGKKVILSFNASGGNNPFDMNIFRSFQCP